MILPSISLKTDAGNFHNFFLKLASNYSLNIFFRRTHFAEKFNGSTSSYVVINFEINGFYVIKKVSNYNFSTMIVILTNNYPALINFHPTNH